MIKGKLSSQIGHRVRFGPPKDMRGGSIGIGTIIDEVWANPDLNENPSHRRPCPHGDHCWGDYSFCSQLIKWNDGSRAIRLAYYRRRCGEDFWTFASQMTATAEPEIIKVLFKRTLAKDDWFRTEPVAQFKTEEGLQHSGRLAAWLRMGRGWRVSP